MNPLDLTGPEFLRFYVPYGVILLVCARILRTLISQASSPPEGARWAPGSYPLEGDAYAIALMRGGRPEVVKTLLSRLASLKLIRVEGRMVRRASNRDGERQLQPIDQAAWQAVESGTPVQVQKAQALMDRAVRPYLREVRQGLTEAGLVPGPLRNFVFGLLQTLVWFAVVGLGLAKLFVALDRGRTNVGFLIVLLILFWIAIAIALKPPHRTSAGSRYLKWLQESHRGLIQKLKKGGQDRTGELALAAGIYGLAGLTVIPSLAALNAQLGPRHVSDSSSSFSDSSSSSSSDSGSSCGGGGCGGCGGGGD